MIKKITKSRKLPKLLLLFFSMLFVMVASFLVEKKSPSLCMAQQAGDANVVCVSTTKPLIPSRAVEYARSQIGKPYIWGKPDRSWENTKSPEGGGANSYDCSGLVGWAYYWASGGAVYMFGHTETDFENPSGSGSKGFQRITGTNEEIKAQARLGDLIYWEQDDIGRYLIHHVAIYSGNGNYIDAPYSGATVSEKTWSRCCAAGLLRLKE